MIFFVNYYMSIFIILLIAFLYFFVIKIFKRKVVNLGLQDQIIRQQD